LSTNPPCVSDQIVLRFALNRTCQTPSYADEGWHLKSIERPRPFRDDPSRDRGHPQLLVSETDSGTRCGREIFYLSLDAVFNVATVRTDPGFAVDSRERLDSRPYFWQRVQRHWDLTPDGQRLLVIGTRLGAGGLGRYVIVQNWFEELRTLAGNRPARSPGFAFVPGGQ
jgi:hypothetical protein